MNKLIIWDLFGGGQNSVYNSLKEFNLLDKYEVYTFDITEPTHKNQFHIDLSQDNIINIFQHYPKPDIIVASPLCQSFSNVLNMKGGGTCFWKLNNNKTKLIERSVKEFEKLKNGFTKNLKADVQLFIKRLGQKCIDNVIELIEYYKPKIWYIENPKLSLIWKYITLNKSKFYKKYNCYFNEASYGKYGFLTTKSTYFLSNVKMNFMKGKIDPPYYIKEINGIKYYVLKDDPNIKLRRDLNSRMLGISSITKMLKARNVKSGMGGMDFVQKSLKSPKQINKKSSEQICEAGPASAIPHKLIKHIFSYFEFELHKNQNNKINIIDILKLIDEDILISELKCHKILFLVYRDILKTFNIKLFDQNFYSWQYGPVELDFRKHYKNNTLYNCKKFYINSNFLKPDIMNLMLDKFYYYSNFNVTKLVNITHKLYSWKNNINKHIPDEDILK